MNISDEKIINTLLHQHQKVFFCLSQHLSSIASTGDDTEIQSIVEDAQTLIKETVEGMQLLANFSDAKGLKDIPCEQFRIFAVINDTIKAYRQKLNGYKVSIDGTDFCIFGNRYLITQVLAILFENAIKYRHPDRELVLEWDVHLGYGHIEIALKDNGIGLPTENVHRIFEWGMQSRQIPQIPGMGIGLNFAQSIVEAHNGKIAAKNNPDYGATFTIKLSQEKIKCVNS